MAANNSFQTTFAKSFLSISSKAIEREILIFDCNPIFLTLLLRTGIMAANATVSNDAKEAVSALLWLIYVTLKSSVNNSLSYCWKN